MVKNAALIMPGLMNVGEMEKEMEQTIARLRKILCEDMGYDELKVLATHDKSKESEYFLWRDSFKKKAEYIRDALNDDSISLIYAQGGNSVDEVIKHLEVMIENGEIVKRDYSKIPYFLGFSDSEQLLRFLGKQGFIHPILSKHPILEGPRPFFTQDEIIDKTLRTKLRAGNEKSQDIESIDGTMTIHNSHTNYAKYRTIGAENQDILIIEPGRAGKYSAIGFDQQIQYLRINGILPSIKAILVSSAANNLDGSKELNSYDTPPVFLDLPFSHTNDRQEHIPLLCNTTISSDGAGRFQVTTKSKRTAEQIADHAEIYRLTDRYQAIVKQQAPEYCVIMSHHDIKGTYIGHLATCYDYQNCNLVVELPNQELDLYESLRFALTNLHQLGIYDEAKSVTFATGNRNKKTHSAATDFALDYCQQHKIDPKKISLSFHQDQERYLKSGVLGDHEFFERDIRPISAEEFTFYQEYCTPIVKIPQKSVSKVVSQKVASLTEASHEK